MAKHSASRSEQAVAETLRVPYGPVKCRGCGARLFLRCTTDRAIYGCNRCGWFGLPLPFPFKKNAKERFASVKRSDVDLLNIAVAGYEDALSTISGRE